MTPQSDDSIEIAVLKENNTMPTNRKRLKPHKFTEDSITYLVRLPDIYDGNGSNIGTALGISVLNDDYEPASTDQQISVSEGQKQGRLLLEFFILKELSGKVL